MRRELHFGGTRRELHFGCTSLLGSAPSFLRTAVIYNGCPRAFEAGIWWPQTKFGQPAAVPCPKGSVGKYHGVWPAAPMGDRTLGRASGSRESWPRRQNSPVVRVEVVPSAKVLGGIR